jgi:hypothetical protein
MLEHFNWELFKHPPQEQVSLWVTTTCLPTWRTGWDHRTSIIMRSWWKASKRGWAHRQQTSLTQAYKNIFPYKKVSQFSQCLCREVA